MLQVARLAPMVLGEAAEMVRQFLRGRFGPGGGGKDRDGAEDLYYTIFAIAGLQALQAEIPGREIARFLSGFGDGEGLDFVHLGALARCWAALGREEMPAGLADKLLARIERHRSRDGGYEAEMDGAVGSAYGCFLALGAYQDLGGKLPEPLRMVQCLKLLETPDGGWGNARGLAAGAVPPTAAAVTLLHQLGMPIDGAVGDWLLGQAHPQGGFCAVQGAPLPDLLSTATCLHALAILEVDLPVVLREKCLDFIDTLWSAEGASTATGPTIISTPSTRFMACWH